MRPFFLLNKLWKNKSRMDNPETLATFDTKDTRRRQKKTTKQNKKQHRKLNRGATKRKM